MKKLVSVKLHNVIQSILDSQELKRVPNEVLEALEICRLYDLFLNKVVKSEIPFTRFALDTKAKVFSIALSTFASDVNSLTGLENAALFISSLAINRVLIDNDLLERWLLSDPDVGYFVSHLYNQYDRDQIALLEGGIKYICKFGMECGDEFFNKTLKPRIHTFRKCESYGENSAIVDAIGSVLFSV